MLVWPFRYDRTSPQFTILHKFYQIIRCESDFVNNRITFNSYFTYLENEYNYRVALFVFNITVLLMFMCRIMAVFYHQLLSSSGQPNYKHINVLWIHKSISRLCATNRKAAGSIPAGVIGIFHWQNPPDRTMALGSTQPLTEISTRSISWG